MRKEKHLNPVETLPVRQTRHKKHNEKDLHKRIDRAYKRIKDIYRKKGLRYALYLSFRLLTCPIKTIFQLMPQGKKYVDVGCGYGLMSLWTALVFPEAHVTGMDVVPSRIEVAGHLAANEGIKNISFQVKDITRESIDHSEVIMLIDLFHHVPFEKQMPFLKHCIDKTPKGGYIVFKDIDRTPWWKFQVNYIQDLLFTGQRTYCRHKDEYMEFFDKHGFEVEYFNLKKGYPYSHHLIRARKAG
jgi:2-polyprenyl-3-methyl-5-hydroxy-6-metoxy-1,4-benzoquinol methylase